MKCDETEGGPGHLGRARLVASSPRAAWLFGALVVVLAVVGVAPAGGATQPASIAVVARTDAVRASAGVLARGVYRDPLLRPAFDEATARAVLGGEAASGDERFARLASLRADALAAVDDEEAAKRFAAFGRELGVAHVVVVESAAQGRVARVVSVHEAQWLPLTLAPAAFDGASESTERAEGPKDGARDDWSLALGVLRSVGTTATDAPAQPPAASPTGATATTTVPAPTAELPSGAAGATPSLGAASHVAKPLVAPAPIVATAAPQPLAQPTPFYRSPWFWGGLGAVLVAGATVLVLTQTTGDARDTIVLEGRIAP